MAKFAVIVAAAGAGKRFGGDVRKPFAQIDGRPIFIRSIELFLQRPDVCQTLLVVAPDDYDVVREKYAANIMIMGFKLVKGGAERHESVRLALAQIDPEADMVCVHDAVRPCVMESWIDEVFARGARSGAAILAAPLTGTIKRMKDGRISETVPRENLLEAQTPQVFRRQLLIDAYAKLPAGAKPTDDAQVVEQFGHPIECVLTDRRNIKITTPGDMVIAQTVLKDVARKPRSGPLGAFEEASW